LLPLPLIQFSNSPLTSFLNPLFLFVLLCSSSRVANDSATWSSLLATCSELMETVRSDEAIRYYRELSFIRDAVSLWSTCRIIRCHSALFVLSNDCVMTNQKQKQKTDHIEDKKKPDRYSVTSLRCLQLSAVNICARLIAPCVLPVFTDLGAVTSVTSNEKQ
jgi:hypothetical protein